MKRLLLVPVAVGLLAAAGPCAGTQLPGDLGSAVNTVSTAHKDAREAAKDVKELQGASDELNKCSSLRTAEVAFEEERRVGQIAAMNIAREGGLAIGPTPKDPATRPTHYLNRVGFVLAARSERPHLPWSFGILADDGINAFSTPGGYVLVTRGLLNAVKNEAQLAGVLAHEIAHITNRHAMNYYREVKATSCTNAAMAQGAGTVAGGVGTVLSSVGREAAYVNLDAADEVLESMGEEFTKALTNKRYPDAQEKQADEDGLALMIAAGYQPHEYVKFLQELPMDLQPKTHPPKKARVASVNGAIAAFSDPRFDTLRSAGAPFGEAEGFVAPPLGEELATLK